MEDIVSKLNQEVRERFFKLERRVRKNEYISAYYEMIWNGYRNQYLQDCGEELFCKYEKDEANLLRMVDKYANHVYKSMLEVRGCSRWMNVDYYRFQSTKDVSGTFTCNNKFCDGCQSALAQQRYEKFKPIIDALGQTHLLAHIVLTVPNCFAQDLRRTLENMYEQRKYLIRFLNGKKHIRGIDFEKYGYQGGVIALELTRNKDDGRYHPHFHCIFVLDKNPYVFSGKNHYNAFSFDKENMKTKHKKGAKPEPRAFTDFEILLQKVWRLRYDGVKVTKSAIDDLKEGYSVTVDITKNYHEVFKYATKGLVEWSKDKGEMLGNGVDFEYLDEALYGRRVIQAYGCLRGIPMPEVVDQGVTEDDQWYMDYVAQLKSIENPIKQRELLSSIVSDMHKSENIRYLARKNIRAVLGGADGKTE